jgi:hypothetical protein
VITIDGQPQFAYEGQQMLNSVQSAMPEGVATSLMAGEQEVTCNVTATYSF